MLRRIVACAALALTAALALPEDASARGGFAGGRAGMTGGGIRAPLIIPRPPARAGILKAAPRPIVHGPGKPWRSITQARRALIPPSAHGLGTTIPLRPFAGLTRRHHGFYHRGWYFPATVGDYGYGEFSYFGVPYDPAEAIPVHGPAVESEMPDAPVRAPAARSRTVSGADEPRDACNAERVTVPASEGERTITVVRC